jgi:hypothetical protein
LKGEAEMKKMIVLLIITISLLASCQSNSVKIINHEEPNIQVDFSPFTSGGCIKFGNNFYSCWEGSPIYDLGCDSLNVDPLLGGLNPGYPIADCNSTYTIEEGAPGYCITSGEVVPSPDEFYCSRFIIYKDGKYQIIDTIFDFRRIFAPVASPEEALSFALAVNPYSASYGQTKHKEYEYYVKLLEDTFVESLTDGYLVHVFKNSGRFCGEDRDTYAVVVKVTYDGNVEEVSRNPVYGPLSSSCAVP